MPMLAVTVLQLDQVVVVEVAVQEPQAVQLIVQVEHQEMEVQV
jgi:hypothetical protein